MIVYLLLNSAHFWTVEDSISSQSIKNTLQTWKTSPNTFNPVFFASQIRHSQQQQCSCRTYKVGNTFNFTLGNSLAVQWLGLCTSLQGTQVWSLDKKISLMSCGTDAYIYMHMYVYVYVCVCVCVCDLIIIHSYNCFEENKIQKGMQPIQGHTASTHR